MEQAIPKLEKKRGKVQHRSARTLRLLEARRKEMGTLEKGSEEWKEARKKHRNAVVHACRADFRQQHCCFPVLAQRWRGVSRILKLGSGRIEEGGTIYWLSLGSLTNV